MIRHSVVFKLKHPVGSQAEHLFFEAVNKLATIEGVENFICYRQTSVHSSFDYGLFMDFANKEVYQKYNSHPEHVAFVEQYWLANVEGFLELDYEPFS
ncbi:Dabb family protein [Emticicia sp. BO119]|uniref:Dabb family protein n=1 Tax=Emticicia sp. BO119 TaxID=2757768 RepID=UPI0015F10B08|nr:Dabb family protein [Emticicia sp. BO119]MBA4850895.1 Dabb family protein [Emticicia sp. BO119]